MVEQEPFISVFEIDESVLDEQTQHIYNYQKPTQQRNGWFYFFQLVQTWDHIFIKKIKIKAADNDVIFGSTCTNTITVPKLLKNKDKILSFFN